MSSGYRWTLDEYVLRCEHRKELREVLVEGELDRDFIADALSRWGADDVSIVDADYVDVKEHQVEAAGYTRGAKGELLTVAAELDASEQAGEVAGRVAVIVDRDYDYDLSGGRCLLVTDGYSIENYALSEEGLNRFATMALGRDPLPPGRDGSAPDRRTSCSGAEIYEKVLGPLTVVAGVRMAFRALEPPVGVFGSWLDYLRVSSAGEITIEDERLVLNGLTAAKKGHEYDAVMEVVAEAATSAQVDPLRCVRGRDFVDLLAKLLRSSWGRKVGGRELGESRKLARILVFSVDTSALDATSLLSALRERFATVVP